MTTMDHVAEQTKLERLLQVEEGSLGFIAEQEVAATRLFRQQLSEFYYQRHQDAFHRLAGLSKLLPISASAKLAMNLLGPVLAAGIACELPKDRAAKLAGRLPTDFLAKLSLYLEPSRAGAIIAAVDENHVVEVAKHLIKQQEFITLASFVTVISESTLKRIMQQVGNDGLSLLKVGFYVEDKSALNLLVQMLEQDQRKALLDAAHENDLWPAVLSLLPHLNEQLQAEMANLAAEGSADVRENLVRSVAEQGDWYPLLLALSRMTEENLKNSVTLAAMHEEALLRECAAQIKALEMEAALSSFTELLTDEQKALLG